LLRSGFSRDHLFVPATAQRLDTFLKSSNNRFAFLGIIQGVTLVQRFIDDRRRHVVTHTLRIVIDPADRFVVLQRQTCGTGNKSINSPKTQSKMDSYYLTSDQIGPKPGWYSISVHQLYSRNKEFAYLFDFPKADMVGYSIYIYHLTQQDVDDWNRKHGFE